jgi:DNA polymerase III subunit beta
MKLQVEQAPFAAWLKRTASVADTRGPALLNSSLRAVAIDGQLTLAATNNVFSIEGSLPAKIEAPGALGTDAGRLAELAEALRRDAPVEISHDRDAPRLQIRSGRTRVALPMINPADLRIFAASFPEETHLRLTTKELAAALAFTWPAAGKNPDRAQLWGAALSFDPAEGGAAFLAAQEGRLGAVWQLEATGRAFATTMLPRPLCEQLWRLCKDEDAALALTLTERAVRVEAPGWTITSKIVDSEPPPWHRWLPSPCPQPVTVDSAELAAALERIAAVAEIDNRRLGPGALLTFDSGTLFLRDAKGVIEDSLAVHFDGHPEPVGVNTQHLLSIIETIGAAAIELHTAGPSSPIRVQAASVPRGAFVTAAYRIG